MFVDHVFSSHSQRFYVEAQKKSFRQNRTRHLVLRLACKGSKNRPLYSSYPIGPEKNNPESVNTVNGYSSLDSQLASVFLSFSLQT